MRCPNCNAELNALTKFCPKCGAPLPQDMDEMQAQPQQITAPQADEDTDITESSEAEVQTPDTDFAVPENEYPEPETPSSGSRKGLKIFLIGGAVVLLAIAALGGGIYYGRMAKLKEFERLQAERKEQLTALMDGAEDLRTWSKTEERDFNRFVLTEEEEDKLEDLWQMEEDLDPEDYESQMQFVQSVYDFKQAVTDRSNGDAASLLEELKNQDPGYASEEQLAQMANYASDMEKLISDGQYKRLEPLAQEWKSYAEAASVKKTGLDISVMQYDFTEYPTVRLYLDVKETSSGASVKELSPNMFYISERDAGTGDFLKRAVDKAVLMNENERLNINLLADTSSSMDGSNMSAAKNIICNFLNTVQFSAGDQVKLTQFNSNIDKSGYFTNDLTILYNTVNGYVPAGQTKLYDSIIYGVQDSSGQEGAKCVIAFTDGMDVGSYNSAQDVVDVVSRYHIPVFIVRIGDSSTSAEDDSLRRIAEASGGSFKNLSQFSMDMSDFYDQIYRQLKEYYVVEYTEEGTQGITQDKEISVYVQNQSLGGEAVMTANPGKELFDSLLGSYLRSYIIDMNNHYYDQLRKYVDDTVDPNDKWSIQWQMQKQVTGGFSNVTAETLMEYYVTDIIVEDENTVRLKASESYDVIYDEIYGDIKTSARTMAQDALAYLSNYYYLDGLSDDTQLRIWAVVTQYPEYILKRGADGKWKFSQYAGDLTLGESRHLYDAEITWQPYNY